MIRDTGAKRRDGRVLDNRMDNLAKACEGFLNTSSSSHEKRFESPRTDEIGGFVTKDHELVLRIGNKPKSRLRDRKS